MYCTSGKLGPQLITVYSQVTLIKLHLSSRRIAIEDNRNEVEFLNKDDYKPNGGMGEVGRQILSEETALYRGV